ncbi:hypothetical protein SpCBS45565_g03126 [Spizellomyces sp. 'palustris']|nr:hypothetical protein SpCBS45565_g03126 [Spizellomyces sp. 'palustris']
MSDTGSNTGGGNGAYDDIDREQDRFLPIANVARLMKRGLPNNAKIAKDAKECVQECVSEFISFITSEASDRCQQEKRKTINGEDILWAMQSLGFENYCETLKVYLHKYREATKLERAASIPKEDMGINGLSDSPTDEAAANQAAMNQAALNSAAVAYALALQHHQQTAQQLRQQQQASHAAAQQQATLQQLQQQLQHQQATAGQQGQPGTLPSITPQQLQALAAHYAAQQAQFTT